jgi:hypothetical protein
MSVTDSPAVFESQIKPLFRESDRDAMEMHFDLWSHDDVSEHADAILERLRDGSHALRQSMAPSTSRPL